MTTAEPQPSNLNVPNALTLLRILAVPVFGWMLLAHPDDVGWRWATTGVFVAAMFTDFVDGWLARRHGLITSFGKLADPIADKALTGMALVGLSIIGELWWWVTIVILVREWGITLMRFLVIRYGVIAANRGGKLKTVLQTVGLVLFLLPLPQVASPFAVQMLPDLLSWVVILAAALVTVLTGLDYLREAQRMRTAYHARGGRPADGS